jgi:hypothetical protein
MAQLQVRGRLPALLLLLLVGAGVAAVVFASFAVVLPVAAGLLVLGLLRSAWYRLTGRRPPAAWRVVTARTVHVGPMGPFSAPGREPVHGDEGPVVDALPRSASLPGGSEPREGSGSGG